MRDRRGYGAVKLAACLCGRLKSPHNRLSMVWPSKMKVSSTLYVTKGQLRRETVASRRAVAGVKGCPQVHEDRRGPAAIPEVSSRGRFCTLNHLYSLDTSLLHVEE